MAYLFDHPEADCDWHFEGDAPFLELGAEREAELIARMFETSGECLALKVMESILALPHDSCRESALHGLGHWCEGYPKRVSGIIDAFLEGAAGLRPELVDYARTARAGQVLRAWPPDRIATASTPLSCPSPTWARPNASTRSPSAGGGRRAGSDLSFAPVVRRTGGNPRRWTRARGRGERYPLPSDRPAGHSIRESSVESSTRDPSSST